jgi:PleD family two-component response regulator
MTKEMLMIDQSHIDSFLVYESEPNVFNIDADAFHINVAPFPNEIPTLLGNEKPFVFVNITMPDVDDYQLAAMYKQTDSPLILYVY